MNRPMRRLVIFGLIAAMTLLVFSSALAQSTPQPTRVFDITLIPWAQMLQMMGVLSAVATAVQWALTKILIQPQIRDAVTSASSDVRIWAMTQFPSKADFDIHVLKDTQAHERTGGQIADVVHDQMQDNARLSVIHDKVILHHDKLDRIERESVIRDQRIGRLERRRDHLSEVESESE